MAPPPERPRLADHVVARLHVIDDEPSVILHDRHNDRLARIGGREWGLIAAADGTRDATGIRIAAARRGAHAGAAQLDDFLEALHGAGMLAESELATGASSAGDEPHEERGERPASSALRGAIPLRGLPDFRLNCNGSGGCCRQYGTTLFSWSEAARARAACPDVGDGGDDDERVFAPEKGSVRTPGLAVALVNGRCAYLADDDRCAIHAKAGALAKPAGCRMYPALYVFDGAAVRVSVSVECACVLASVTTASDDGEPLAPNEATAAFLEPTAHIARLPESVALDATRQLDGPSFARLCDGLHDVMRDVRADVPEVLFALADALAEGDGPDAAVARAAANPRFIEAPALHERLRVLHGLVEQRVAQDATWRSERDLTRRAVLWLYGATEKLLHEDAEATRRRPAPRPADEAFYVRAYAFGLGLETSAPLIESLRDRGLRLLLARALEDLVDPQEQAARYPLALLEALMRGHGLASYVRQLG